MGNIIAWVGWGWIGRRIMEVGGLAGTVLAFYAALPPGTQDAVERVITGRWQDVTLGAIVPLGIAIWGYFLSWKATTKPQVVVDGKKVPIKELKPSDAAAVKEVARTAPQRPKTLQDFLNGILGRG